MLTHSLFHASSSLISGVEHSLNLPVGLLTVQPLSTLEDGCHWVGCVGHLHTLQVPPTVGAAVVVLHFDPQQLPEVQHLHNKTVCSASLKQVAELLPQMTLARVTVDAVDGDENIGVRSGPFYIPGDDDDFVLDRDQVADFAREALDGLEALECQELVLFGCQGDLCIAVEEIPKQEGRFGVTSTPSSTWHFI